MNTNNEQVIRTKQIRKGGNRPTAGKQRFPYGKLGTEGQIPFNGNRKYLTFESSALSYGGLTTI